MEIDKNYKHSFYCTLTNFPLGCTNIVLPEFLNKRRGLRFLVSNPQTREVFNDNLCLFRCLAVHRNVQNIERSVEIYSHQWCQFKQIANDLFGGVSLDDLPELEKFFQINMYIFHLDEDIKATTLYASADTYQDTLYMNAWDRHLMLVTNLRVFCKKFVCDKCIYMCNRLKNLKRHVNTCTGSITKLQFPGKYYKVTKSIFTSLEEYNIKVDDPFYSYFAVYDYEALLKPVHNKQWVSEHKAISVSVCSNVPGFTTPQCFVHKNLAELLKLKIDYLEKIQGTAEILTALKWEHVNEQIDNLIVVQEKQEINQVKDLKQAQSDFNDYISVLPVIGYNSSKYDLNLVKRKLAHRLNLGISGFIIKKQNAYTCISTQKFKFIDANNFVAPGTSYDKFLKSYHCSQMKTYFPYEWFDDEAKLTHTSLPPYDAFYSKLKGHNTLEAEYNAYKGDGPIPMTGHEKYIQLHEIWRENNMTTFRDWVIYYNNLDVEPFVEALEKMRRFYMNKQIDVFKQTISVPGIARILLFRSAREANASFSIFDNKNKDLYHTIKKNIVGGPSIIFHRHQKAGKSKIRNEKTCQKIVGYDCNALYLWALAQPMPVGPFIRRLKENEFKAEKSEYYTMSYHWLNYTAKTQNLKIDHYLNSGKETRILGFPVNGFDSTSQTIYQYHGCYYHGHTCRHDANSNKMTLRRNQTSQTTKLFRKNGYKVIEKWECEVKIERKQNLKIRQFIDSQQPSFFQKTKYRKQTKDSILSAVSDDTLFGFVECDIAVPERWEGQFRSALSPQEYFSEMCPLFGNVDIPFESIGDHMQNFVRREQLSNYLKKGKNESSFNFTVPKPRRLLAGVMKATKILLSTSLLKWYLEHGLKVGNIYQVIEFKKDACFQKFCNEVSDARREGDINTASDVIANTMKLIGNSGYGSLIMDVEKHQQIKYVKGEHEAYLYVKKPNFKKVTELENDMFEFELLKKKIKLTLPIYLGFHILQLAKLRMLSFYFDCIDQFCDRSDFQLCEMDTDSLYMAISADGLDDIIKPEFKNVYFNQLRHSCQDTVNTENFWFPRICCEKHRKYDRRTPGLFKIEHVCSEMILLCSKSYVCKEDNQVKFSSKGLQKDKLSNVFDKFQSVLTSHVSEGATNIGFQSHNNTMYTYQQFRNGLSYYYIKRQVLEDGLSTKPSDVERKFI